MDIKNWVVIVLTLFLGTVVVVFFKDWTVTFATFSAPLVAVQVQKIVELYVEKHERKIKLFEQLMATRAARLSHEHVRALNMIDLVFYKNESILNSWKSYLDHLANGEDRPESIQVWLSKGEDLFIKLLSEIAKVLKFDFHEVHLKRGAYFPKWHAQVEDEQAALRRATLALVKGENALKMNVTSFPSDPEAVEAHKAFLSNVGKAFESGSLKIEADSRDK